MSVVVPFRRAAVATACAVAALSAVAQSSETIVVTGAREPMSVSRLAADVVVIDAEAIRNSTADSLANLLRKEAGVQLTGYGGPGASTSLLIRGARGEQAVVLVDGVRVGSATLGTPSIEALPLAQIERVEVLRGPGSSLYGADAIGGVVNVVTRRPDRGVSFDAYSAIANRGGRDLSAGAFGAFGAWELGASFSRVQDDGEGAVRPGSGYYNPDHDGYVRESGQARVGFAPAAGHRITLSMLRSRLDTEIDQSAQHDDRTLLDVDTTALEWRGSVGSGLTATARLDRGVDDSRTGYHGGSWSAYRTTRNHALAQLAWETGAIGQFVGAVERLEEKATTSAFPAERDTNSAVLAWTGQAGRWAWQADVRHDRTSDYDGQTTGRLGGSIALTPEWRVRALVGNSFRAPSSNALFDPDYGNPSLRPERSRSAEVGITWKAGDTSASALAFRNQVRDWIEWAPVGDTEVWKPSNTNRVRLQGATFGAAQTLGNWVLRGQVDFLDATNQDTGSRMPRRAAHQESLSADWRQDVWNAGVSVLRVGERPDLGGRLDAETTLDVSAGWRIAKAWTLESKLLNATDRDLQPAEGYRGPGRRFWLGLRYEGGTGL